MPKLIVYVKAETWRRVEAGYGLDAPALMRNLSVEAIEEFLGGLSEGEPHGDADPSGRSRESQSMASGLRDSPSVNPSRDTHFRPDFGSKLK